MSIQKFIDSLPSATRLTVLSVKRIKDAGGTNRMMLRCRCSCGVAKWMRSEAIRKYVSCGCLRLERSRTHGMKWTRVWKAWQCMKNRCLNPNHDNYHNYGGKGIRVCRAWMKFESFYAHIKTLLPEGMADIPKGLTLERKDNDKDYSPSNVVLATTKEQGRHRSTNRLITIGRRTACLNEWCEIRGFKSWVIRGRLRMGWSEYDAVMTPLRRKPCPSNTAPRAK